MKPALAAEAGGQRRNPSDDPRPWRRDVVSETLIDAWFKF
ncbi:MAG: hypothetical protein HSCHL_0614 [Hydrogenibacillus schlegelii]|uniref:Uncharacterized protein n=1 Tax=Hydrogenibacillus schlegelii TaxID=1484 RepID=A0A2T5G7X4_HYDSH|nr:MAG: hypothetical protein HSCHL_0614 [Hydrogenibacillus schlegelii]